VSPNGDSLHSQQPLSVLSSDISSVFRHALPGADPTLSGDCEIPWVPLPTTQETEFQGEDITLEDFFRFVEQDPSERAHQC
jgi:hypothetical protein